MTTVFLSDIHANLEALQAVLAAVDGFAPDRIICLGDVVGYGASPNECLELVRSRCKTVLLGNHDAAASGGPEIARFNIHARVAAEWTSRVLTREHREFLQRLPLTHDGAGFLCVHASPATPRDWVFMDISRVFSPGGATVISQGREPLESWPRKPISPGGATVGVAPPGLRSG